MSSNYKKQVRFSNTNQVHELDTPGCSAPASASNADSDPPFIPPSTSVCLPGPSPYKLAPTVTRERPGLRVHRLLRFTQEVESTAITFDMRDHPYNTRYHLHPKDAYQLTEAATSPPLQTMFISHPDLPTHIAVTASSGFITVQDVLEQVYRYLRGNITSREYYAIPHECDRQLAARAFEDRYARFRDRDLEEVEKMKGMKRVDLLKGRTLFAGLSATKYGSHVWKLNCK